MVLMENCGGFHIPALFSKDFFKTGFTLIPNMLLKYNATIKLGSMEILFIVALFYFQQNGQYDPGLGDFAQVLNLTERDIRRTIEALQAKGLLDTGGDTLELTGLFEKIADLWAEEKVQALQQAKQEVAAVKVVKSKGRYQTPYLSNLLHTFEQEFGRPLTPMECTQIIRWYKDAGYSEELIMDALKRAIFRGIFNLNYIDKILLHWEKNNLRTTWDVSQYEEKYMAQQQRKNKARPEPLKGEDKEEKYKDIYLT
jgi:DNA replication protein